MLSGWQSWKGEHLKQVNLLARMCSIVVKSTRHKSTGPVPPVTSYMNVGKLFPFSLVCKIGTVIVLAFATPRHCSVLRRCFTVLPQSLDSYLSTAISLILREKILYKRVQIHWLYKSSFPHKKQYYCLNKITSYANYVGIYV